ncbi:flagellin [Exiguobacterium sp. RIT341]|uniref:flagellin N-terminal helical domain-containing protein n=1 Tax=Exiguobacterium sp. RIT341 TaxID=1470592 RepID=UPI00044FD749|nr:flagellin [Exiguobacterium sp. RIT341]EZP59519.1 Flagellin domain protein [Exiguobacterium sp. RIT341]
MIINHNVTALNTHNKLSSATAAQSKSMEKLASGLRINKAGDDAAGLAISEKMRAQVRGLDQAGRNAQDGISLIQTAEGALNETHDILQRMNELSTQAANGNLQSEDRTAISDEITQLNSEIDRIASSTNFNGKKLLDGTFGVQLNSAGTGIAVGSQGVTAIDISGAKASTTFDLTAGTGAGQYVLTAGGNSQTVTLADNTSGTLNFDKLGVKISLNGTQTRTAVLAAANGGAAGKIATGAQADVNIQIGANTSSDERLGLSISAINSTASSLNTGTISVATDTDARAAMDITKAAINKVSAERSKLGANQNRLEHTINNLKTSSENLTAAESRVRDVDMAKEMMNQTKNSILAQAAQAMLAQSNQTPQGVLQLLR